jgi:hypothetical protein
MDFEAFANVMNVWVGQYAALFCLGTLALMAFVRYLAGRQWDTTVRDFGLYLISIATLATVLFLAPTRGDSILWPPLVWFCFTMLLMLELFWLAYLLDRIFRAIFALPAWLSRKTIGEPAPRLPKTPETPYSREYR